MTKYQWVILDSKKQEMRCNRCGEAEPLSIMNGKRLDFAIGVMKAFTSSRKKCEEAAA